jgi:hypothetical protein
MSNDVFVGLDWAVHTHAVCLIETLPAQSSIASRSPTIVTAWTS